MTEEDMIRDASQMSRWQQHKFMVLVGLTIGVSLVLVSISLHLYVSSGASQLDLSRPGYKEALEKKVEKNEDTYSDNFTRFPSSGALDAKALNDFRTVFDAQLKEATAIDSFGGDVMSDVALSIDAPADE